MIVLELDLGSRTPGFLSLLGLDRQVSEAGCHVFRAFVQCRILTSPPFLFMPLLEQPVGGFALVKGAGGEFTVQ